MRSRRLRRMVRTMLTILLCTSVLRATAAAESPRWSYVVFGAGQAADALTTTLAIRSGRAREGNPLLPGDPGKIIAMKSLLAVPQVIGLRYLATHGHPKLAKMFGYGIGAGSGVVAWRNTRVVN